MDYLKEIKRRDKRITDDKKIIGELKEEVIALRQLLDCAAANIALLVKESGGERVVSKKDVSETLGKYSLRAKCDEAGNYVLKIVKENTENRSE